MNPKKRISSPRHRLRRLLLLTLSIAPLCGLGAQPAAGLTIHLSLSPESVDTPFDPGAVLLTQTLRAAADHWEEIIQDPHTLDIVYGYWNLPGMNAAQTCFTDTGVCIDGVVVPALPTTGFIAFDSTNADGTNRLWYLDPTPDDHSEYAMEQVLYRDLAVNAQGLFYNGPVSERLEVSFAGDALPAAPLAARNGTDGLMVALHEIGHLLGIANEFSLPESELDGDFDFDASPALGNGAAANIFLADTEHLRSNDSLMGKTVPKGQRRLPAATDLYALAQLNGWQDIHLPRREFLGGLIWGVQGMWAGGSVPDLATDAWVRHSSQAHLLADGEARNLTVSDDSRVVTASNTLQVAGSATVEYGQSVSGSEIEVEGQLNAGALRIRDGGRVEVAGGQVSAVRIETEPGGVLAGWGNAVAWEIDNDGLLAGLDSAPLLVTTFNGALDLDGTGESGEVEAAVGDLVLSAALADPFDGLMTIYPYRFVNVTAGWTLGPAGQLVLAGDAGPGRAQIGGGELVLQGGLQVTGLARAAVPLRVEPGASVVVEASALLEQLATTELAGGTYTGAGQVRFDGTVTVSGDTLIQLETVDLDGSNGDTVTVLDEATLDLQVGGIEPAGNVFDGVIQVNGGTARLGIELGDPAARWTLDGILDLVAPNLAVSTQLSGSDVIVTGQIYAEGRSRLAVDLDLEGSLAVTNALTEVVLDGGGINVFRQSAEIGGPGHLLVESGTVLQLENGFDSWLRLVNGGRVEPGTAIGSVTVQTYLQHSSATLAVEIGDVGPNKADHLRVIDDAELDGALRVDLIDRFVPALGDSFEILSSRNGSVLGTWDQALSILPKLPVGLEWNLIYSADTVTLEVVAIR